MKNENLSYIDTGAGNDTITGTGVGFGLRKNGIYNVGTINTGSGNDSITGTSSDGTGIYNVGIIDTGTGCDIVDALTGGFSGDGIILLGDGNDIIKGFGSGFFDGGNGNKDWLLFGTGSYTVSGSANGDGFYTLSQGGIDMLVKGFEFIGSASNPAGAFSFNSVIGGSFTI